jgi:hypothetical protein
MRPLFSLWSDYGTPGRKYRMSVARPSIIRKMFLTAVIVAAAAIGIRELYGQIDKRGLLEPTAHPQSLLMPQHERHCARPRFSARRRTYWRWGLPAVVAAHWPWPARLELR